MAIVESEPEPICEGCKGRDKIIAELSARIDELERAAHRFVNLPDPPEREWPEIDVKGLIQKEIFKNEQS